MSKIKSPTNDKDYSKLLYKSIKLYSETTKLPLEKMIEIFNEETTKIINKKIDPDAVILFEVDEKKEMVNSYNANCLVVEDEEFENLDDASFALFNISLTDAKKNNKNVQVGDWVKTKINLNVLAEDPEHKNVLKIILQSLIHGIKTFQKTVIFEKYSKLIGEKIWVECTSKNNDGSWNVKVKDDNATAHLPHQMISKNRDIQPGQRLEVVIEDVKETSKLSQIRVSLDSPKMVEKELMENIPEIAEGLIEIVKIYRSPGERTKVAVRKTNKSEAAFDLQGAIIGAQGERIKKVSEKLNNERIDIIEYSSDIKQYIINAMSPGKIVDVVAKKNDDKNKHYYVIVEDDNAKLTVAIGSKGINVKLASNLTETFLDVKSTKAADELGLIYDKSNIGKLDAKVEKVVERKLPKRKSRPFETAHVTMASFDNDVAAFELEEQETLNMNSDWDFEELFTKYNEKISEINKVEDNDQELKEELVKETKQDIEDYKKAKKVVIEDFKVDSDLANFGLDGDIDLSEFDDEDWN
ncbi:transcription termination/antitermination protein NusA [Mycoplasmopsis columbina]|uniref:transcription termination/antitermination protein NusA n=1 Tax=Mycoplasmopsis columbina TaxID=114881 RepID=UPI000689FD80|nr:transcription termination/antitermination protein NusA [Mycoplasmopsis columbina]VEU76651.1 Transcription elongation protein nusA [Mycoplasmopsis columbina]